VDLLDSHPVSSDDCDHDLDSDAEPQALNPYFYHVQYSLLAGKTLNGTGSSCSREGGRLAVMIISTNGPAHHGHTERAKVFRNESRGFAGRGFHRVAPYSIDVWSTRTSSSSVSTPSGWSSPNLDICLIRHPTLIHFNRLATRTCVSG